MPASLRVLRGDLAVVVPAWLCARVLVLAGWVVAKAAASAPGAAQPRALADGLQAWDGGWYREIAAGGYDAVPADGLRFYPLHPLLGRLGGTLLGGHEGLALVVIANVASLAALVLLRRLVVRELGSSALAERSVWMLALWPASFVLAMAYGEAVFLVLSIGTFLLLRDRRWLLAGALGLAAALVRPTGMILAAPAAIEVARQLHAAGWPERARRAVAVLGPAVGGAAFLAWAEVAHGDALAPLRIQEDLRGEPIDPISRLWQGFGDLLGAERLGDGLHVPFALLMLGLLVVVLRSLPASYGAYCAGVLALAIAADNLNSLERYGLNAFPLLIGLAIVAARPVAERAVLVISGAGMACLTALAMLDVYVP